MLAASQLDDSAVHNATRTSQAGAVATVSIRLPQPNDAVPDLQRMQSIGADSTVAARLLAVAATEPYWLEDAEPYWAEWDRESMQWGGLGWLDESARLADGNGAMAPLLDTQWTWSEEDGYRRIRPSH